MNRMEEQRRSLKQQEPDLYRYIVAVEASRALDAAAEATEQASNVKMATRRVLDEAGLYRKRAVVLQQRS